MSSSPSDLKLIHLVRKFLSFSDDSEPNDDHVVHCLRAQHREYQRKDLAKLKKQVHKVLKHIKQSDGVTNEDKTSSNGDTVGEDSKPAAKNEDKEEEDYDKEAVAHDHQRNNGGGAGSLNASLIAQYRKLQQDRAEEAAIAAVNAAVEAEGVPADIKFLDKTMNSVHSSNGRSKKRTREDGGISNNIKPSSRHEKNGKSSKRKKDINKRSSTSSSGLDAYQKGESNRGDGATRSEAVPRPTERYVDLGGMEDVLKQIRQLVEYPLVRPELYRHLGVDPPRGVLLRGPPG